MNRSQRLFLYASGIYLLAAAVFGIIDQVHPGSVSGAFAYSHFYLLGFVSMAFFGLGYYLFPRLNRSTLRFPRLVQVHLVVGNISLVGLVLFQALHQSTVQPRYLVALIACMVLQVSTLMMFVVNIWMTLTPKASRSQASKLCERPSAASDRLQPDETGHTETISADMLIIDVKRRHPRTEAILARHFGTGCAGCPSQAFESIALACRIHDADLKTVLDELRAEIGS